MLGYIFLDEKGSFIVNEVVGATNLASDIYIICLPITAILRLQLPKRKRVGIMLIFLTGLLYAFSPKLG